MKIQVKNKRPVKGEKRRDVRDYVNKLEIQAENTWDEKVMAKIFRVFMKVGSGGINLAMDRTLEEIAEIEGGLE